MSHELRENKCSSRNQKTQVLRLHLINLKTLDNLLNLSICLSVKWKKNYASSEEGQRKTGNLRYKNDAKF